MAMFCAAALVREALWRPLKTAPKEKEVQMCRFFGRVKIPKAAR
jgi:hypothetical protein